MEKGHVRIEKKEYFQTSEIEWFKEKHLWKELKSICMVRRTITIKEKTKVEDCYYISNLDTPKKEEY